MGEILGLGITHWPGLWPKRTNPGSLKRALADPAMPEAMRVPSGWPARLREEWADDEGSAAGEAHREKVVAEIRKARQVLDEFKPDFAVIWADDQYENFQEDLVPAFSIMAYDQIEARPWAHARVPNYWDEAADTTFRLPGHRAGGKFLTKGLLGEGFDVAYAYKPLHADLGHGFMNTVMYLDWDRRGFDHAIVPFQVNCLGKLTISAKGYMRSLADPWTDDYVDPPSPSPARCFELGAACVRVLAASPWRVALIASSSWSHAFLTDKNHQLYPDIPADRKLYEALSVGDYETWRGRPLTAIEESGQQEMLNWYMLVGAMEALGRKPDECEFVETWTFNSNKCFAVFKP